MEPVTLPSQASLILRESRNGKRTFLQFLAISGSTFCCVLCHLFADSGPRERQLRACHRNGFKVLSLIGKCLLLCLMQK